MATNNQYELRIKIEDATGESSQIAGGGSAGTDTSGVPKAEKSTSASLGAFVATQAIKPFVQQAKNFFVSNVELITGSAELQQRVDFDFQMLGDVGTVISTTSAGGAIGGGVGIAVGAVVGVLQVAMGYFFNQQQINLEAQVEDRKINYLQNRAGPAFNMSRRGN